MATLHAERLTVAYAAETVLTEIDVRIPTGQMTVLVGRNGSGKSTLLRTLARLLKPCGGTVFLDGTAIARLSSRNVARRLGILPQGPVAPEGVTVRDLVAQGRYPHQSWLQQWSSADEAMVARALEQTGMAQLAARPLDTLSGGQRQKAWIAMALAQDTEILLLDEPTTYLDMAHQIEVLELLSDLNRTTGRTVVMVLHDLNQACRYAHHVIALGGGQIIAEGSPTTVVTETMVHSVFGLACRIIVDPVSGTPLCVPIGRS